MKTYSYTCPDDCWLSDGTTTPSVYGPTFTITPMSGNYIHLHIANNRNAIRAYCCYYAPSIFITAGCVSNR